MEKYLKYLFIHFKIQQTHFFQHKIFTKYIYILVKKNLVRCVTLFHIFDISLMNSLIRRVKLSYLLHQICCLITFKSIQ